MRSFKVLSLLLCYPQAETLAALDELPAILHAEAVLPLPQRAAVARLIESLREGDLLEQQERYVGLFDRARSLSLHMFEHVHGDSRDRGQAMVDLAGLYRQHGLEIEANELPDYLPLFLEFLSTRPLEEAKAMLADTGPILAKLHARLVKRDPAYAGVLGALLHLAGVAPEAGAGDDAEDSTEAIDRAWEETAVSFGGPDGLASAGGDGCPMAAGAVRRMQASA